MENLKCIKLQKLLFILSVYIITYNLILYLVNNYIYLCKKLRIFMLSIWDKIIKLWKILTKNFRIKYARIFLEKSIML